ncbi:hypothetical protein AB0M79_08880 [Polymorphospora sp. NPDC051019]|uniref:ABC transporter permease n=1 Tax=Polymorphospora sp. NPDC051019 TaxID=3155725 RepID=UPI00343E751F
MSARRVALRLAVRGMRRDRRRTFILLAALVVPLAVAAALSTVRATSILSPETRVEALIGQSQSVVNNGAFVREQGVERALATGSAELSRAAGHSVESYVEVNGYLPAAANGRQVDSFGYGVDLDAAIHRGRFHLLDGRTPRGDREVALSQSVAERLGVGIGDEVGLGPDAAPATVTGVVAIVTDTLRKFVVTTPLAAVRNTPGAASAGGQQELLPGRNSTVLTWHVPVRLDSEALRARGWSVSDRQRAFLLSDNESMVPGDQVNAWILGITVLVVAEIGLVLGAVYAIVVRGNRRELGLLASAGAGPGVRRAVISYQGLLAGVAGVVIAIILGIAAAFLIAPLAAARSFEIWGPVRPDLGALAVLAVLGIATPAVSALVAARGVALDVVAALRDQPEPVRRSRRRGLLVIAGVAPMGIFLLASGAILNTPMLVLVGALSLVCGVGYLLRGLLPALGERAGGLPLLHRIGLRAAARSAPRAAALGTVIASLTLLAGLVLGAMGGLTAEVNRTYIANSPDGTAFIYTTRMPSPAAVNAMTDAFEVDRVVGLGLASPPPPKDLADDGSNFTFWGDFQARNPVSECMSAGGSLSDGSPRTPEQCVAETGFPTQSTPLMVIAPDDLSVLLNRAATQAELAALAQHKVLVLDRRLAPDGTVTVDAPKPDAAQGQGGTISVRLPALVVQERTTYRNLPAVLVTEDALDGIGAVVQPNSAYFYVPAPAGAISPEQEDRARGSLSSDIGTGFFSLEVERGPTAGKVLRSTTVASIALLVLAAATLAFVTVSLATQDMRPDLSALAAAGANRRFRSLLSASHAGQVTLLGVFVGSLGAVVAMPALLAAMDVGWSFWPWLGLFACGLGAVAAAGLAGWFSGAGVKTLLRRAY